MSYHIVNIDSPECSLSCKRGQLTCKTEEGTQSIPLEDVAAIIVTSFSAIIHTKLILETAKLGVSLIICEKFKPVSLMLPANRATDTLLTRAQVSLSKKVIDNLWMKTIHAKTLNQLSLAQQLAPTHPTIPRLRVVAEGRKPHKESLCARDFWSIYGDAIAQTDSFKRGQHEGDINPLLNYGYAILLSMVLQNCFALGVDPTFGIHHAIRERSTPLAYDLMEPFRPCVDWRVAQWVQQHQPQDIWEVTHPFKQWITGFPSVETTYQKERINIRTCIEKVIRSFRKSLMTQESGHYQPWTHKNSKWAG